MRPSSAATRCAPAFTVKFSSVQVRPERNHTTGTFTPPSACGGTKAAKRIGVPVSRESWRQTSCEPPKARERLTISKVMAASSVDDDGTDRLALVHQVEGGVDLLQRHGVGDEIVDVDLPLHVPVDDLRHVRAPA